MKKIKPYGHFFFVIFLALYVRSIIFFLINYISTNLNWLKKRENDFVYLCFPTHVQFSLKKFPNENFIEKKTNFNTLKSTGFSKRL